MLIFLYVILFLLTSGNSNSKYILERTKHEVSTIKKSEVTDP